MNDIEAEVKAVHQADELSHPHDVAEHIERHDVPGRLALSPDRVLAVLLVADFFKRLKLDHVLGILVRGVLRLLLRAVLTRHPLHAIVLFFLKDLDRLAGLSIIHRGLQTCLCLLQLIGCEICLQFREQVLDFERIMCPGVLEHLVHAQCQIRVDQAVNDEQRQANTQVHEHRESELRFGRVRGSRQRLRAASAAGPRVVAVVGSTQLRDALHKLFFAKPTGNP